MKISGYTLVFSLVAQILACVLIGAEERALFPPVTRQEVWQAVAAELERRGIRPDKLPPAEGLDLPVAVPAAEGRVLRVTGICRDRANGRTQFRLECSEAGQCLPFFAYLPKIDPAMTGACCVATGQRRDRPKRIVVRAGERAMLVYATNRLRLTATVTCLERGGEGEIIRVRNQDGRIFQARVAAPGWLEAWPE